MASNDGCVDDLEHMGHVLGEDLGFPVVVHISVIETHDCQENSSKPYNLTIRVDWPEEGIEGIPELVQRLENSLMSYSAAPGTVEIDESIQGTEFVIADLLLTIMIPGWVRNGCIGNSAATCETCGEIEGVVAHIILYAPMEGAHGGWKFVCLIHPNHGEDE